MASIDQLFDKTHLMPTIPKVVQELIDSFSNEDVDVESIAKKVGMDQVLTAKVLRLANSSYYGLQRQIGSVDEAIVVMGLNSLRTLVVATGVTGAFAPITGFDRTRFWKRSLLVAAYCRWLAKKAKLNPETSFTAGLMHAIGEVLIHLGMPQVADSIDDRVTAGARRTELERAELGFTHCEVGTELARRWNFPTAIQDAIAAYDEPLLVTPVPPLAALVHVAAYLVAAMSHGATPEELIANFPRPVGDLLHLDVDALITELPPVGEMSAGLESFMG